MGVRRYCIYTRFVVCDAVWASFIVTFVRVVDLTTDDGITIPVPILLEGEESVVEFIDLPYNGVSLTPMTHIQESGTKIC